MFFTVKFTTGADSTFSTESGIRYGYITVWARKYKDAMRIVKNLLDGTPIAINSITEPD